MSHLCNLVMNHWKLIIIFSRKPSIQPVTLSLSGRNSIDLTGKSPAMDAFHVSNLATTTSFCKQRPKRRDAWHCVLINQTYLLKFYIDAHHRWIRPEPWVKGAFRGAQVNTSACNTKENSESHFTLPIDWANHTRCDGCKQDFPPMRATFIFSVSESNFS